MTPDPTPGLLLAGGLARRMGGGDKPMKTIGGRTILDRVIARLGPQCDGLLLNANGDPQRFASFGLPVVADASIAVGAVRVVLANDYTGPGSGLGGDVSPTAARVSDAAAVVDPNAPAPSPILTAGSDKPECID